MGKASVEHWLKLADHAFTWAKPNHPFAAHTSVRPYMTHVPKDKIGEGVDRGFWLGEVLDDIRRDAAKNLSPRELREYDEGVEQRMRAFDRASRKPAIPMLHNPPRVYRAQKVVAELQKETRPAFRAGSIVTGPDALVRDTLADYLGARATEVFLVIFVNIRNQVVGYIEYNEGAVAGVTVQASGILRDALTSGAAAFITVHNHPTGDATPSEDDRALWKRLRAAGDIVGVPCMENMIIGENEYFSEEQEKSDGLGRTRFTRGQP